MRIPGAHFVRLCGRDIRVRLDSPHVVAAAAAVLAVSFAAGASGCADAGGSARVVQHDSAGVTIVENVAQDSAAATWWRLEGPVVDIGGESAEGAAALFRVSSAARLPDGTLIVANAGSSELRFFDDRGQPVRTVGRNGTGPGEFQALGTILVAGDSLLAFDPQLRRASVFTADGRFVRDFQLRTGSSLATLVGRFGDDRLLGRTTELGAIEAEEVPQGVQRPALHFIVFTKAGEALDTVARFPGDERVIRIRGGRTPDAIQSIQVLNLPFGRRPSFAVAGDALVAAPQESPELRIIDTSGTLRRIVRTGGGRVPATAERLNARIEQLASAAPEPLREGMRESYGRLPAPAELPPYGPMLMDDDGRIWLSDTEDPLVPRAAWTVFDREGVALARIHLPDHFRPLSISGDFVVGVMRDDLDVEHLQVYRISHSP